MKRNSVKAKQIAPNAVRSSEVRDGSLRTQDFGGQAPAGLPGGAGPTGPTGPQGDKGDKGDPGPLVRPEDYNVVGDADGPPFLAELNTSERSCSDAGTERWENYAGGFHSAGFYRDPFGRVHLRGLVKKSAAAGNDPDCAIFNLPAGYRPEGHTVFSSIANNQLVRVSVYSNGEVDPEALPTGGGNFLSLEGISFRCGPSGQNGCP